jgi:hypothetical protein
VKQAGVNQGKEKQIQTVSIQINGSGLSSRPVDVNGRRNKQMFAIGDYCLSSGHHCFFGVIEFLLMDFIIEHHGASEVDELLSCKLFNHIGGVE